MTVIACDPFITSIDMDVKLVSKDELLKNADIISMHIPFIKSEGPTLKKEEFEKSVREALGNVYYLEVKDAERENPKVPILLKNSNYAETFESLTGMYALPKYNEIDPTPFLAPFYTIFFGMMAADVGYGLIMLLGTFFVLKKS